MMVAIVQSLSHVQLFTTSWTAACQASLSFTISQSLHKFTSIESVHFHFIFFFFFFKKIDRGIIRVGGRMIWWRVAKLLEGS